MHHTREPVLYRLGSLQNAKVLLHYRGGVFILGSFLGLPAPCHFVRHRSSFRAAMAAIFGFGGDTNFLLGVVLAKDGQRSFASCKCDDVHGYHMCFFCTCSFVFNFYFYFWYSCDNTNARHHKRSSGRQWGQRSKNTKNIKQTKRWQKMESLQKGCLKINEFGKTRNREPEVVSLQNDAWNRHLKSQLLIKRSSANVRLPYSEESRHLIKWGGCLKSNEGAKTLCFL